MFRIIVVQFCSALSAVRDFALFRVAASVIKIGQSFASGSHLDCFLFEILVGKLSSC
jgi:hypothetical protein